MCHLGAGNQLVCTDLGSKPCFFCQATYLLLVFSVFVRYQSGVTDESIENLARKLADAVPEGLRSIREDLEKNFRSVLQSGISKLDLVTREEFEVQEAVLRRTREKLEALAEKLDELEKET